MNTARVRRLFLVGLPVLLALMTALPAFAMPPEFSAIPVNNTFEDPDISAACGFPVVFHEEGTLKIALHFDQGMICMKR